MIAPDFFDIKLVSSSAMVVEQNEKHSVDIQNDKLQEVKAFLFLVQEFVQSSI